MWWLVNHERSSTWKEAVVVEAYVRFPLKAQRNVAGFWAEIWYQNFQITKQALDLSLWVWIKMLS
jgi:hypothetical protein